MGKLEEAYKTIPKKDAQTWQIYPYNSLVTQCLFDDEAPLGIFGSGIYKILRERVETFGAMPPSEIRKQLEQWRLEVSQQPKRFYDFQIPSNVALDVVGNRITSPITAVVALLQIALGPVLFIWLTSLLCTRAKELQLARHANINAMLFPHILNSFPLMTDAPRLKKKGAVPAVSVAVWGYVIQRAIAMACLVTLSAGAYLAALVASMKLDLEFPFGLLVASVFLGVPMVYCIGQECVSSARQIVFFERVYGYPPYRDS